MVDRLAEANRSPTEHGLRLLGMVGVALLLISSCTSRGSGEAAPRVGPTDSGTGFGTAEPAGERSDVYLGRYRAALADERDEGLLLTAQRISFTVASVVAPDERRDYLISFEAPVAVDSLVGALQRAQGIGLIELHTWLATDDTVQPGAGVVGPEEIEWPEWPPDRVAQVLRHRALPALRQRLRLQGNVTGPVAAGLANEDRDVLAAVERRGVEAHGLRCLCSPSDLLGLVEVVPGLTIRAFELSGTIHESPIWPTNPLRDLIIETHGQYGR